MILAVLCLTACGSYEESKNEEKSCLYNSMYWGISKEDVIAEKGAPQSYVSDDIIQYDEQFIGTKCETQYCFNEGMLNKIIVSGDTLYEYDDIKDMYVERFGEPVSEDVDDNDILITEWTKDDTVIRLTGGEKSFTYEAVYSLE